MAGRRWPTRPAATGSSPATVTGIDPTAPIAVVAAAAAAAAGMRPISLAVDVTNYVMLELGQPMHAYDATGSPARSWSAGPRPGRRSTTLDDVERALDPEDLLITDDSGADRPRPG